MLLLLELNHAAVLQQTTNLLPPSSLLLARKAARVSIFTMTFFKVLLCFMSPTCLRSTWDAKRCSACIMQHKTHHKQNSDPWLRLNIHVVLKTTDCCVISASDPRRWKTLNNYEFYRRVLSVHEWSHSQA